MRELHFIITDADAVLTLEPEELAGTLLILLRNRIERDARPISVHNCILEITSGASNVQGDQGYLPEAREEVALAVAEAFAWLKAQALLMESLGSSGWSVLSRRARRFETAGDFRQFLMARRLNRDLLHPAIAEDVWLAFVRGRFAAAVFEATVPELRPGLTSCYARRQLEAIDGNFSPHSASQSSRVLLVESL